MVCQFAHRLSKPTAVDCDLSEASLMERNFGCRSRSVVSATLTLGKVSSALRGRRNVAADRGFEIDTQTTRVPMPRRGTAVLVDLTGTLGVSGDEASWLSVAVGLEPSRVLQSTTSYVIRPTINLPESRSPNRGLSTSSWPSSTPTLLTFRIGMKATS